MVYVYPVVTSCISDDGCNSLNTSRRIFSDLQTSRGVKIAKRAEFFYRTLNCFKLRGSPPHDVRTYFLKVPLLCEKVKKKS